MTPEEIIALAREVRTAQKTYFRDRTNQALAAAKALEKKLDAALDHHGDLLDQGGGREDFS